MTWAGQGLQGLVRCLQDVYTVSKSKERERERTGSAGTAHGASSGSDGQAGWWACQGSGAKSNEVLHRVKSKRLEDKDSDGVHAVSGTVAMAPRVTKPTLAR